MRVAEKTRREIEARLTKMGDYVKIDYLRSCLKNSLDFETRRFVLIKLSALYENKRMFFDAGKLIKTAAEINTTARGKIDDFIKSSELFIYGGHYDEADSAIRNAATIGTEKENLSTKQKSKSIYFSHAKRLFVEGKRKNAAEIYERILRLELNEDEKTEVQKNLLELYDKLGRVRDYFMLKKQINN